MQRQALTLEQLHTRLKSTCEMLREVAEETHRTQIEIMPHEMNAEDWYQYRDLSHKISDAAAHAAVLADTLNKEKLAQQLDDKTSLTVISAHHGQPPNNPTHATKTRQNPRQASPLSP
jgi:hypothetical protein